MQSLPKLIGVDFVVPVIQQHRAVQLHKPLHLARQLRIEITNHHPLNSYDSGAATWVEAIGWINRHFDPWIVVSIAA